MPAPTPPLCDWCDEPITAEDEKTAAIGPGGTRTHYRCFKRAKMQGREVKSEQCENCGGRKVVGVACFQCGNDVQVGGKCHD